MKRKTASLAQQVTDDIARKRRRTMFPAREIVASNMNCWVPSFARDAVFPHWQHETAVTLRQVIQWAGDDLEWLLTRARCDREMFYRIAYGVISDESVPVDAYNGMAERVNDAFADMQRQRVRDLDAATNVSTYWTDLSVTPGERDDVPANVVRLRDRREDGEA